MSAETRCAGRNAEGGACGCPRQTDSCFCLWHDPTRRADAEAARRKGGRARAAQRTQALACFAGLRSFAGIHDLYEQTAIALLTLPNDVSRNRALIATGQAAEALLRSTELQERLDRLEDEVRAWSLGTSDPKGGFFRVVEDGLVERIAAEEADGA